MILASALMCLTLNIYFEARGEPEVGQLAVGAVTMNRAGAQTKICDTVMAKGQFSWTSKLVKERSIDGAIVLHASAAIKDLEAWERSQKMAIKAIKNHKLGVKDVTKGATYYHATHVKPNWDKFAVATVVIGRHVFYRQKDKSVMTA